MWDHSRYGRRDFNYPVCGQFIPELAAADWTSSLR